MRFPNRTGYLYELPDLFLNLHSRGMPPSYLRVSPPKDRPPVSGARERTSGAIDELDKSIVNKLSLTFRSELWCHIPRALKNTIGVNSFLKYKPILMVSSAQ